MELLVEFRRALEGYFVFNCKKALNINNEPVKIVLKLKYIPWLIVEFNVGGKFAEGSSKFLSYHRIRLFADKALFERLILLLIAANQAVQGFTYASNKICIELVRYGELH